MSFNSSLDGSRRTSDNLNIFESAIEFPVTADDLDAEDAEGDVLQAVEEQYKTGGSTSSTLVGAAAAGSGQEREEAETKLYQAVSSCSQKSNNSQRARHNPTSTTDSESPAKRFKEAAERVRRMNMVKNALSRASNPKLFRRRSSAASAHSLLLGIQEEEETEIILNKNMPQEQDGLMKKEEDDFKQNPYAADFDHHLLKAASGESVFEDCDDTIHVEEKKLLIGNFLPKPLVSRSKSLPGEEASSLPLHANLDERMTSSDYIATNREGFLKPPGFCGVNKDFCGVISQDSTTKDLPRPPGWRSSYLEDYKRRCWCPRTVRELCAMCHPWRVFSNIHEILQRSLFLWIGFPCLLASCCLFYLLGNPYLTFIPGEASVAWWLLFVTRQTVTLGLARLTVYVLVDGFMLGTRLAVQTLGPLLTLIAATSKGWPLILSTWGVWNLVLLHGDNPFQRNWLYWTRIDFFNQHYDGLMMNNVFYTRVLISAVLGGVAVSAKRTIMALRFGRKQFAEFKPRLERILADVVLLSEIAALAESVDQVDEPEIEDAASWDIVTGRRNSQKKNLKEFLWAPDGTNTSAESHSISNNTSATTDASSNTPDKMKKNTTFSNATIGAYGTAYTSPKRCHSSTRHVSPRHLRKSDSGRLKIKDMMDSWEEPDSKGDKSEISIHDILRFRRALSHLDEDFLFGEAFGCTSTRDECIASSHSVYYRLVKLAPNAEDQTASESGEFSTSTESNGTLPFDVLALLTLQEDGTTENVAKKRMIRKIFIPDQSGALPLLAFVQAVDKIYKRLRYFRASIRNASAIDGVLERLVNGVFYCVLAFMLSSLMQFNPWALMVSITSLLVSVSFALGTSISHYVEGVLLIAVRRPFDLGDRIFMSSAESINPMPDVTDNSWFVENITLTTTTLRYTRTNEVCTVHNWSIAGSRIVNCARSPRATVHMEFTAHTSILEEKKLEQFQSEVKRYVEEHPRVWDSVAHIRHDHFDADNERIDFTLALRHRNSWQEAGRIRLDRSNFYRYLFELGNKMDVHFAKPPDQRITYTGGVMKRGDNDDCYMRDLLRGNNLVSKHTCG